jgi:hypothetical protein
MELMRVCTHYQLYFPTEGLYVDHGDDPYSGYANPVTAVIIDEPTYVSWFGPNTHNEDQNEPEESDHCHNVGRTVKVLSGNWP